jgi:signal transduction histidine kinase
VSIRLRVAAVFTVALAVAFTLGSWLLVSQLQSIMLRASDAGLVAQLSQAGRLLSGSPATRSPGVTFGQLAPGDYVTQLIDASGRVQAASPEAGRAPLLTRAEQAAARRGAYFVTKTIDGDRERVGGLPLAAVTTAPARSSRAGWIAASGVSLESSDSTVSALVSRLVVGGVAFVLIAGVGAYLLARAALAPAERLRREAAAISDREPAARLAVPRTRDEIAALAGTMNDLLGRLQGALARQRAFVADASHELRTPFAVLRGELELAGKPGRSQDDLRAAVASAAQEAARLSRITEDLLLLARSDEDQLTVRIEPADVTQIAARSAAAARRRCAEAGVTCEVSATPGVVAEVDPDRIRQAVDNLLDNASRFAPPGSRIELSVTPSGPDVTISVADQGPGFPADYLPHAFERFRRPDQDRARSGGGAGLGLAIAQAIARAHGGVLTVANRDEGGAMVTLTLPVARRVPRPASQAPR